MTSHLTLLQSRALSHPTQPIFRLPQLSDDGKVVEWGFISYSQFHQDVDRFARYWATTLSLAPGSVVGLWIGGFTYADVLNIYGISRAGYIPQLFSLRLPNPTVLFIYDTSYTDAVSTILLPKFLPCSDLNVSVSDITLPSLEVVDSSRIAFIFHTSGSTSGSPKLVPCTYQWVEAAIHKTSIAHAPYNADVQDVAVYMGSMCHIGQACTLLGHMAQASCLIQPTKIAFSSEELFAAFLSIHLRNARSDPKLLSMLVALDEVLFAGMPLPTEDETFARANGINLVNLVGSTECGPLMKSLGGRTPKAPLLAPIEGTSYEFRPVNSLVVLADSPDCPHVSLRGTDGNFHTGDLYQEISEGVYLFRGRDDDWIKTETSLRCDTKSIEDTVRQTCTQLVSECITTSNMEPAKLAKEIMRKTRAFNQRRYLHERLNASLIVVVPCNTLPRTATKGNIRRKAVEEQFSSLMDELYAKLS
ncbi:hypothetical protein DL96DRAFT_1666066 [Flagelloscypha sp. PMI_526]|nr:hypothetical protein DL96DRAFT_1666066 [Flagelloscypha sp. PMI_526]